MHVSQPTVITAMAHSRTWARTVLRWMPTFLGFPIGGFAAEIVGPIDAVVPALVGGAITGAILGFAQWLGMRRTGPPPIRWIIATAAGLAVGLAAGASAVGYRTSVGALAVQGAVCGVAIGTAQAVVLRRIFGRVVWAWPAVVGASWALGWIVSTSIGVDVESQYTVFGSSGALVVTAATSVLAVALSNRQDATA